MFLKKMKQDNGRIYLAIYEGYRTIDGRNSSRSVLSLGYLDELEKTIDDPVAYYTKMAADMTDDAQNEKSITITLNMNEEMDMKTDMYNVGYLPYKYIYDELGLSKMMTSRQRKVPSSIGLNHNLELLVFSRILFPGSKKFTFDNRNALMGPFQGEDISMDTIYDSLDYFAEYKDQIEATIWKNTKDVYNRDASKSYYDCTNYYFEIEYNDQDMFDKDGNIIEKGLRKRGPEKNKRPDPIVEMGLLMDASGIPMAFDIFPGNESEKTSLRPILKKTKAKFGIERTIVVADRGLNTSDNIYFLAGKNDKPNNHMDGYVYGQSVRGADKEFKEWVLNEEGYRADKVDDAYFIHKSRVYAKEVKIMRDGKRKVPVRVCQKQMVYFSFKYMMKQRNDRQKMVEKAKDLIAKPGKYTKATSYGAAGYIKNIKFDKETGEVLTDTELLLDEEKIKEEALYDGYYSIVTSEIEMDDFEIRKVYRGLARIEDTFKVTKSNLESRPVYVWTPEHIKGHFVTCFIALVLLRLLEARLEYKYSVDKIIDSTRKYNCTTVGLNAYKMLHRDEIIDDISEKFNVNMKLKNRTLGELKKILRYK